MAHLGLCAFRQGNVKDAHNCLVDLMMTAKVKELLAQGLLPQVRIQMFAQYFVVFICFEKIARLIQRQHERSKEQEKIEKQRQMPFHMHINLELLECVYLVAAMLIEIPYMAGNYCKLSKFFLIKKRYVYLVTSFPAHEFDARRRMISKTFYQQLRSSERQSLVGPPESMREHIVAASKAMRNGNWQACINYIINDKMNAKVGHEVSMFMRLSTVVLILILWCSGVGFILRK
jgi:translation initiation factor 3 subunit C